AVIRFDEVLRRPDATAAEKNEALKFLIHFVADAHQPMHVARARDRGGNDVRVKFLGKPLNLHQVWDFALLEAAGKPWPEYTRDLEAGLTAERVARWTSTDPLVWANESYRLAVEHAYAIPDDGRLGRDYFERNIRIVNERLAMAGVRLAVMLNAIFGEAEVPQATTVPATAPGAPLPMPSIRTAAPVGR
ncbi:MAG TPA: S1/P1 nuclease, partial [Phycisphaerae bacterium]|nr:S1/P1 nuclease [Phycisphaerae bacterium]